MTKKRSDWEKLNRIFAGAVELSVTQQSAYLVDACGGDKDLLREAKAVLAASDRAASQDFLEADAFAAGAKILAISSVDDVSVGKTIGNYKIIKEIGRGGMGAIYLAEREDFQHRVALKVIKRGMDTDEIVRRFEQEREVLAALNHPNIARLLDGGTTDDGLPFLVMENVEGSPLTAYADDNVLNVDERLTLFRKICSAVAYAHQNLIVHRDLKPSNILVDCEGEPKLLDFGIAKLLTPERSGQTTETGFRLLTPEYASPEQIRGERVTTSSDVYSLGVLLYELLTGKKPYQITSRNAAEIMRVVCETAPERPSSVVPISSKWPVVETTHRGKGVTKPHTRITRSLKGDLDNIILKALQKDPETRYSSVEQFSEDIDRYLTGLPVTARRATFSYQFSKFVERNRTAVAFASVALIAILAGSSVAVWQAVVARQERARAENRLAEIRKLTGNLVSGWDKDIPENQITSLVRGRIADISSGYLEGLANETQDPAILKELGESYLKLGHEYAWGQVNDEKAKASFLKAESIARGLIASDSNDFEAKDLLARALSKFDEFYGKTDRKESLRNHFERLRLREDNYAAHPGDEKALASLANAVHNCGWILKLLGRNDEAVPYYQRAAELTKQQIAIHEPIAATIDQLHRLSGLYSTVAMNQSDVGLYEPSLPNYRRAAQIAGEVSRSEPAKRGHAISMAVTQFDLGVILKRIGDLSGSQNALQIGLDLVREQNSKQVDGYTTVKELSILLDIAENDHELGDDNAAMRHLREAFAAWHKYDSLAINNGNVKNMAQTAALNFASGKLLTRMGKTAEARSYFERADKLYSGLFEGGQMEGDERRLASLFMTLGDVYSGAGICRFGDSDFQPFVDQSDYCRFKTQAVLLKNNADTAKAKKYFEKAVTILSKLEAAGQLVLNDSENLRIARERVRT